MNGCVHNASVSEVSSFWYVLLVSFSTTFHYSILRLCCFCLFQIPMSWYRRLANLEFISFHLIKVWYRRLENLDCICLHLIKVWYLSFSLSRVGFVFLYSISPELILENFGFISFPLIKVCYLSFSIFRVRLVLNWIK